jgi:curli biogenesis system outer membrane secretion channel CsgG
MMSRLLSVALAAGLLAGCGASNKETYTRGDTSELAGFSPPPAGFKKVRAAIMPFKQKMNPAAWWARPVGEQAGEQFETLVSQSDRFQLIERLQLDNLMREQNLQGVVDADELAQKGRIRGVDYLFLGAITEFSIETTRQRFDSGAFDRVLGGLAPVDVDTAKTMIKTVVGVDIKLVNATTGEILVKDFDRVVKEQTAKAWGVRVFGIGGNAKNELRVDADGQGRILRFALDQSYRKLLPAIDAKFSREQASYCPTCKTELAAGQSFCTKCGKGADAAKCAKCGAKLEANARFCGGCGTKVEGPTPAAAPAPGPSPAGTPAGAGDYLPENILLAFDGFHWFPALMKTPPSGEKREAEFVTLNTGKTFFSARFAKTRPAAPGDLKPGVTVYAPNLGFHGKSFKEAGAVAGLWKNLHSHFDATTVVGTDGLEGGVFQAPLEGNKDIHVSNVRVAVP